MGKRFSFQLLSIVWMGLIFFLSSQPSFPMPALFWGQDKLFHLATFGILGLFAACSLNRADGGLTWRQVLLVTILVAAYGVSDEYHQSLVPGREASLWDVLADAVGGFLAALIVRCQAGFKHKLGGAN